MFMRSVGCTIYAAWIGCLVGMVLAVPAAVVLINVSGLAVISTPFVCSGASFLSSVLAVTDRSGSRRGSGPWVGVAVGLLAMATAVLNGPDTGVVGVPDAAAGWAVVVAGFATLAGVGFVAGRVGERAARWAVGTA